MVEDIYYKLLFSRVTTTLAILVLKWTCSRVLAAMLLYPTSMSAFTVWKLNEQRLTLIREILVDWELRGIDVVICPGFGTPAMPIGYPGWLQAASSYTSVYNLLNFPVGSLPVKDRY